MIRIKKRGKKKVVGKTAAKARKKAKTNTKTKAAVRPKKAASGKGSPKKAAKKSAPAQNVVDSYNFDSNDINVKVQIRKDYSEYVPLYLIEVSKITEATEIILERIRDELIRNVSLGTVSISESKESDIFEKRFKENSMVMINKFFPDVDEKEKNFLVAYLYQKSLGFGNIQFLLDDNFVEEVVVNNAEDPVWLYHKKYGWLKTNVVVESEQQIKHYSTMIGRKMGRQISVLEPMLDAHISGGNRVNATLSPISIDGNTMTFRKFSTDPLTITHFLEFRTLTYEAAALIWHAIHYEMSALISGGTATGKTSALNVLANFFPPNQRIISIEDTREIRLPKYLHWVPLMTRLPNAEGKGEVTMGHLLVNSLRMRPDRIVVGEVRRKAEIETLFEAIHTGHSCYATIHANDANETVNRLVNPPFDVPKTMLPAVSLIISQFRNRRTGVRRTFQIAEVNPDSSIRILQQYDPKKDLLKKTEKSKTLYNYFRLYSGLSVPQIEKELKEKVKVLQYLVKNKIRTVDGVGKVIAEYYTNKNNLMKYVKSNRIL